MQPHKEPCEGGMDFQTCPEEENSPTLLIITIPSIAYFTIGGKFIVRLWRFRYWAGELHGWKVPEVLPLFCIEAWARLRHSGALRESLQSHSTPQDPNYVY